MIFLPQLNQRQMQLEQHERAVTIRITLDNVIYAAGAEYAQQTGRTLKHWFECAVTHYAGECEDGRWQPSYPIDKFARELFIHLYCNHREAIPNGWGVLAALIDGDKSLWRTASSTQHTSEFERECQTGPHLELDLEAVRASWPQLVTRVF